MHRKGKSYYFHHLGIMLCFFPFLLFLSIECRLKIFVPLAFLAFTIMVPVNWTNTTLKHSSSKLTYSNIDKLSISNIPIGSNRYAELSHFKLYLDFRPVAFKWTLWHGLQILQIPNLVESWSNFLTYCYMHCLVRYYFRLSFFTWIISIKKVLPEKEAANGLTA